MLPAVGALVVVLIGAAVWAARRARAGGVIEDPHRPPPSAAAPVRVPVPATGGSAIATAALDPKSAEIVREYLLAQARLSLGIDLSNDRLAVQRIDEAGAKAAELLRRMEKVNVDLPFIYADASGPKHLNLELHRAELEAMVGKLGR